MKTTFSNLLQEVHEPGLCHRCGGCVSFCTAINYGALKLDDNGVPVYADQDKCIECGICYSICPVIGELEQDIKEIVSWQPPMGRVIETTVAAALDQKIRQKGTDGGVVTSLLLKLMKNDHIDGAIVSKHVGLFQHQPWLATSAQEISDAAGSYFDASKGMVLYGDRYSTFIPSIQALRPILTQKLRRVAFVGVPCQIQTIRKMEAMGIVPSDSIHLILGLFCSGNFSFDDAKRQHLETLGQFKWDQVKKINIKDDLMVSLKDGRVLNIPLDKLDFMKRQACRYCPDYAAEYADISFGGIGAPEDWTTVMVRTPKGRAAFAVARKEVMTEFSRDDNPKFASQAHDTVLEHSNQKKAMAQVEIDKLESHE